MDIREDIEMRMAELSDAELLKICRQDRELYTQEALDIAGKELERRSISLKNSGAEQGIMTAESKPDKRKLFIGLLATVLLFLVFDSVIFGLNLHDDLARLLLKHRTVVAIVSLVIMVMISFCGYRLAQNKGRDPDRWKYFCFIFSIFALIFLWSLPDLRDEGSIGAE